MDFPKAGQKIPAEDQPVEEKSVFDRQLEKCKKSVEKISVSLPVVNVSLKEQLDPKVRDFIIEKGYTVSYVTYYDSTKQEGKKYHCNVTITDPVLKEKMTRRNIENINSFLGPFMGTRVSSGNGEQVFGEMMDMFSRFSCPQNSTPNL
jgi:hypothetical protein